MKKIILSVSAVIAVVAFTACSKSNSAPSNTASVMFVNGCVFPTATSFDARVNGTTVSGASNIAYTKSSGYQYVTAGSSDAISFAITGLGTTVVSATENIAANNHYTIFAGGTTASPSIVFASDDVTAPSAGNAKVRFVNLCSDNISFSGYVNNTTKVDSNINYQSVTPYFEVTPSNGMQVAMIDQDIATISANITSQTLQAGKIYTIVLTGTSTSAVGSAAYLKLTVYTNN